MSTNPNAPNAYTPLTDNEIRFILWSGPDKKEEVAARLGRTVRAIENVWTNANPSKRSRQQTRKVHPNNRHVFRIRRIWREVARDQLLEAETLLKVARETGLAIIGISELETRMRLAQKNLITSITEIDLDDFRAWDDMYALEDRLEPFIAKVRATSQE